MKRPYTYGWLGSMVTFAAQAHEGHGLPGASHWHASDLLGFALALAVVIGMIWFNGRDR
jgi:hypothetical protein